jgi:hypothetical protein
VIHHTRSGSLQFERLDSLMSNYTRLLDDIPPEPSLSDILQGVARFNLHLSRRNSVNPLKATSQGRIASLDAEQSRGNFGRTNIHA